MKTRSSAKTLASLLILFAIHATATVVPINSDQSDYTFLSGTTYYVSANVTLSGTTTFQGGTILKYNGSGQINIPADGTIVCDTATNSAIFTSYNDNSVGEAVSGSSGTPGIYNYYTETGNDVNTFLNVTNVTLTNLRFSYAYTPLELYAKATLQNCQFFYDAFLYPQTAQMVNNLFVHTYLDWFASADNSIMQNNTFVSCPAVILDSGSFFTVVASDNLFDSSYTYDWTSWGAPGANNAFYNCANWLWSTTDAITLSSAPAYQTGPFGSYYLPSNSPLIDAGYMSAADAGLDAFTTQTSQTPDSGKVDIGFHYPVLNYLALNSDQTNYTFLANVTYFIEANITLYGITTFESGTVLKYNGSGQINIDSGGTIISPTQPHPAIFTSYNDNTVGATIPGSSGTPATEDINTFLNVSGGTLSNMRFYYALSVFPQWSTTPALQNCEFFYDETVYVQAPQIFNCLFVESYLDWWSTADTNILQNSTFVNCPAVIMDGGVGTDVTSDNLFDSSQDIDWTSWGTVGGNNAFYNCYDELSANVGLPTDITLYSEPDYQIGPLGNYYLPTNSTLIDAGDMTAVAAGLDWGFTTGPTQRPDNGTVDIGYHYPHPVFTPPGSTIGTNFWLMFPNTHYDYENPSKALSLLITSAHGASGMATAMANGTNVVISGCGDANANGTYVLTNLPSAILAQFETEFGCNPDKVYWKDPYFISLTTYWSYSASGGWDLLEVNPDPGASFPFLLLYYTTDIRLGGAVWNYSWDGVDSPPTSSTCTWEPVQIPFTLAAGGGTNLALPREAMAWLYDQVEDHAVQVTSTAPVAVYGMSYYTWDSTAFTAYPNSFLGTNYCVLSWFGNSSQFGIVGTVSNTTVTITPPSDVTLAGSLWTGPITLQPGQTYQINQINNVYGHDVTGTRISSDKPIGVFAGTVLASMPDNITEAANPLMQEQIPVEDWGMEALSLSFAGRTNGENYRVLAAYNNTAVTITGTILTMVNNGLLDWSPVATNYMVITNLMAGQGCQVIVDGPAVFQANKPIQVAKFGNSIEYDNAHGPTGNSLQGDPCEIFLTPVGQWLKTNVVVTLTNDLPNQILGDFEENYLNLIVAQSATNSTSVDGSPVDMANYVPIGVSGYFGAQIIIANGGAHTVISSQPVGVEVYGWGVWDSYSYFGGIGR